MVSGEQLAESPVDARHAMLDGRYPRFFQMLSGSVKNLQLIAHERIHVADDTQFFRQKAATFPFVEEHNQPCRSGHDEAVSDQPPGVTQDNKVRDVPENQEQNKR